MDVGREIRRQREAKGWSQAKLAAGANMGVSGISQIETGARNPSAVTLSKIAEALGVGVADLFPKAQAPLPNLEEERREPKVLLGSAHIEGRGSLEAEGKKLRIASPDLRAIIQGAVRGELSEEEAMAAALEKAETA